jgi:hypothetical protein
VIWIYSRGICGRGDCWILENIGFGFDFEIQGDSINFTSHSRFCSNDPRDLIMEVELINSQVGGGQRYTGNWNVIDNTCFFSRKLGSINSYRGDLLKN